MKESAGSRDSRARVELAIAAAAEALSVEQISAATSLHANTVRGHLDVLLASGAVTREAIASSGRGRPRWLYRLGDRSSSPYQFLAQALTAQIALVKSPAAADAVAEQWVHALPTLPAATSPDEAVEEATTSLNRLGFTAAASAVGDAISITGCPYADLVRENPVICDIHTMLVDRLLTQTGQHVGLEEMQVWARPGICVARLSRPDLEPSRTIAPSSTKAAEEAEGMPS